MASRDRIFLDTDVALDHLADRQPFAEYAHRIFALAETGELTGCVSSLSFSNLYYILRDAMGSSHYLQHLELPIGGPPLVARSSRPVAEGPRTGRDCCIS